MDRRGFLIEVIHVADNRRPINWENVASIAESIKEVGLANPPAIRIVDSIIIDGEEDRGVPVLIHGRHRLEALKSLGIDYVECLVHSLDERDARIMEIDENVRRVDITEPELGLQLSERKRLYEEKHPETRKGANNQHTAANRQIGEQQNASRFTADTAKATGKSERVIQRSIQRVEGLGPDTAEKISGTSLASGVEMDALMALPKAEQESLVERAAAGERVSARQPKSENDRKADQRQKFWKMWAALDDDVREDLHAKLRSM